MRLPFRRQVWVAVFEDLGHTSEGDPEPGEDGIVPHPEEHADLSPVERLQGALPSVKVAVVNYFIRDLAEEYGVRVARPPPGRWRAFLFTTAGSRTGEEVVEYQGLKELRDRVLTMVAELPTDDDGVHLKTSLSLGEL